MKGKMFVAALMTAVLLNAVGSAAVDNRREIRTARRSAKLVAMLPASDGVAVVDAKRFFDDSLTRLLSANQRILGEITAHVSEFQAATGIDLRKFEQLAVGMSFTPAASGSFDFDAAAIANGDIDTAAVISQAKTAAKDTFREETAGGKTIYIFSPKDLAQKSPTVATSAKTQGLAEKALSHLTKEVALAAIDRGTLVIGSPEAVRLTLSGGGRISPELSSLLGRNGNSMFSFALKMPPGVQRFLPAEYDSMDESIAAVKYMWGSVDLNASGANFSIGARTGTADQAMQLKDTVSVLKTMSGGLLSASKKPDQQMYGRILKSAKLDSRGTDVSLDLLIPQADIDVLAAKLVK